MFKFYLQFSIYKNNTMLKFTNSLYRHLTTRERVFKTQMNKYCISHTREIIKPNCIDLKLKGQFNYFTVLPKEYKTKKRPKLKVPSLDAVNRNYCDTMSHCRQNDVPSSSEGCCGGNFMVYSFDNINCSMADCSNNGESIEPPYSRRWETVGHPQGNARGFQFKVVSYNVLSQYLLECHPYLYKTCAPRNLKWDIRAPRLFEEIVDLNPDILCLQEVEVNHLSSFYSTFEDIGYCGIFKRKTGENQDGCAIYFKKSLFDVMDELTVEYNQPRLPLLNRDNIGLMVKLLPKSEPKSPIVIATTHLLYNPKRTDVRLAQLRLFLAEIDRFAYYNNGTERGYSPVILTGDFNSTPESPVIKLLNTGAINDIPFQSVWKEWEHIGVTDDCQHLSVILNRRKGRETYFNNLLIYNSEYCDSRPYLETPREQITTAYSTLFNGSRLGYKIDLKSAYPNCRGRGEGDEVTTFQDEWVTVDYIYHSNLLKPVSRLQLPTAEECEVWSHLPNGTYASDHLALGVVFELIPPQSRCDASPLYSTHKSPRFTLRKNNPQSTFASLHSMPELQPITPIGATDESYTRPPPRSKSMTNFTPSLHSLESRLDDMDRSPIVTPHITSENPCSKL